MTELANKQIAVVGFGLEGASAARFLKAQGAKVTICDQNPELDIPADYDKHLGSAYLKAIDNFDLIVRSPGIRPWSLETTRPVTSPTQLFLERCPAPVIGVTGTKGKGTTATLIAKLLEAAGHTAHLGGNIGTPMLDLLPQIKSSDFVVLELSSFQLIDVTISPHIAVVLMIEPDHLDWHPDIADYVRAKTNIARFQTVQDYVIYHAHNVYSKTIAETSSGRRLAYLSKAAAHIENNEIVIENTTISNIKDVGLIGSHNLENICAAVSAVWQITQQKEAFKQTIMEFKGLEHRLEFVRELNNVKFYNDSFSTNPSACIAALRSFDHPIILIAGGSDKGAEFDGLGHEIMSRKLKKVLLIGDTGAKIAGVLERVGYDNFERLQGDMKSFVRQAAQEAEHGDVVLLSPASASFGLFKSYKERGRRFKEAVLAL